MYILDGFPRYRITKPVYSLRATIPQVFVIVGTVDVQMTINCCKNSVSLINNLSGKYSMSRDQRLIYVTYEMKRIKFCATITTFQKEKCVRFSA